MSRRGSRWDNPVSALQAARFGRQLTQAQIIERLYEICPGHDGQTCRTRVSKLSNWERGISRPSVRHIESLCKMYRATAENLGLVVWRTPEERERAEDEERAEIEKEVRAQLEEEARIADARSDPFGLLLIPVNLDPEQVATLRQLVTLLQEGASPSWIGRRLNELRRGFEIS